MSSQNLNFIRKSSNSANYVPHGSHPPLLNLYLVIYNNEKLKLTPNQMREIFTKEAYFYSTIKMHLHKWNYRIQFGFETRDHRNDAIQEIRRIKEKYDVGCYFYFQRGCATYSLMEEWEYRNAINFGNETESTISSALPPVPSFVKPKSQMQLLSQNLTDPKQGKNNDADLLQKKNEVQRGESKINKRQSENSEVIKQQRFQEAKFLKRRSQRQTKTDKPDKIQIQKFIIKTDKQAIIQQPKKVNQKNNLKQKITKSKSTIEEGKKNDEMIDQRQQKINILAQKSCQKDEQKISKQNSTRIPKRQQKVKQKAKQKQNDRKQAKQSSKMNTSRYDPRERESQNRIKKKVHQQDQPEQSTPIYKTNGDLPSLSQMIEEPQYKMEPNKFMEIERILKDMEMVDQLLQLQILVMNYVL